MSRKNLSAPAGYEVATCRVLVEACQELERLLDGPASRGRLVNYLRGNQTLAVVVKPAAGTSSTAAGDCYGVLDEHSAAWVSRALERLADETYLERELDAPLAYRVTAAGRRLIAGRERPSRHVLPHSPRLGSSPAIEEQLRLLRARLARDEGRPAFSVFDNRALAWIASTRPTSLAELARAPGFGERRLAKYGRRVISALRRARDPEHS